MAQERSGTGPIPSPQPLETTATLLGKCRGGDKLAQDRLVRRFLPVLLRWAHGRIPPYARGIADTDDLVQVTLVRALSRIEAFEPRHEGAFLAYLRTILLNKIRDIIRRTKTRGSQEEMDDRLPYEGKSPLDEAVGSEFLEAYEQALGQLPEDQREAVILRIEFGYTWQEIAEAVGSSSWNATRMTVSRALVRIAEVVDDPR